MGYDGVGNLKSMLATLTGLSSYSGLTSYTNNSQDELTQEQSARLGGYTNTFGYDSAQNPTTFRGNTLTFNADNQNKANVYDGNGNPTTYNGVSLSFDPENRLTAYGSVMTAGYTGDGLRAWKQNSSGKTYFLYDGIQIVCELDSNGNVVAVNTFGDKGLLSRHTSSGSVFYTFDPTGNVTQRLDANDNVLGSYAFDAFGNRSSTDSSTDPFSGYGSKVGYYTDWETGLSLLGYRYYDPGAGRFLNRDPIGYGGGVNLYNYTGNNPANANDPSGLYHIVIWAPYQGAVGTGEVISDPGDMVPICPHMPGTPWWPSAPGMGPIGSIGAMPDPVGGHVIVGPFPISTKYVHGHPFPPGAWPVIGFRPGNQFNQPPAYGPGGVIVGGNPKIPGTPAYLGTWVHGYGLWNPGTGMISPSGRTWHSPTHGCIRGNNGDIEQLGDIINLNPGRGWIDYYIFPVPIL